MTTVVFKTDMKIDDIVKAKPGTLRKKGSKYDVIPVGAYIATQPKNHKAVYQNLYAYGKRTGKKFSSVTDIHGVSRIFRIA